MEMMTLEQFTFTYPGQETPALHDINLLIRPAELTVVCGPSGCGKTTLVRSMKREIAPYGQTSGRIFFRDHELLEGPPQSRAGDIGFVMQDPDHQIVTDTVWHELAFGLENMGLPVNMIRRRVAEIAHFFGINSWFERSVLALSGGQKQILNLAAVTAMQPRMIILDEPVAQLDPIATREFLDVLRRIHHELGTTIVITEHVLEDIFSMADQIVCMDSGRISFAGPPQAFVEQAMTALSPVGVEALPTAVQIVQTLAPTHVGPVPLTVGEGRVWLQDYLNQRMTDRNQTDHISMQDTAEQAVAPRSADSEPAILLRARDLWYRYQPDDAFALRGFSLDIKAGRVLAIVGGNGSGKSTALHALAGLLRPQRGRVRQTRDRQLKIALLPQDPRALFVSDTLRQDLALFAEPSGRSQQEVLDLAATLGLESLLDHHPLDLSGGEQQKAALGMLLLTQPDIFLLDEPTKGLDIRTRNDLAEILTAQSAHGVAVVIVTHDLEFAAAHAHTCAMIFNGEVTCVEPTRSFFSGNTFYTTAASRISRGLLDSAITREDVISQCQIV